MKRPVYTIYFVLTPLQILFKLLFAALKHFANFLTHVYAIN
jgi:hypothetical protein